MSFKLKNFSVGQFNYDVNNSQNPDEKFNHWAAYRNETGRLLCGAWENCIVLGAGALNDLDLHILCGASRHVVLADIDAASIHAGLQRQMLLKEELAKIEIVRSDFSGAQKSRLFERLEAAVQRRASADELAQELQKIMSELKPEPLLPGVLFDLVLSCPVYTQLVYTQIEVLLKILHASGDYHYEELNEILLAAHDGMKGVLRNYNELMLGLLPPGGKIAVMSDIMELPANDPRLMALSEQIKKDHIDESLMQSLIDEQGNGLSIGALTELETTLESPETRYFIWPFDEEKTFVVKCLAGRRKSD